MSIDVNHSTLDELNFPAIVYKYRDWNHRYHKRFIDEREVFMAAPSDFEDDKDCKIPTRYDLLTKKQIFAWAMRLSEIKNPNFNRDQRRKDARDWIKKKMFKNKKFLEEHHDYYSQEHNLRRGVLSLTEEPCLEEMWNKYANKSEGFCIGYNSRIMFEYLGGGGKVIYHDVLPIIFPEPIMEHLKMHALQLYSKEMKWEFEKEYRTHKFWPAPATIGDRQIQLPKEAFNKIILGKNISQKNRNEIIMSVKNNIGDIPIFDEADFCVT